MSTPITSQQQQAGVQQPPVVPQGGPPPVPATKPILSSPGAYMANFVPPGVPAGPTAGIHGVNKQHEKPVIAARPIPPPTLPKYTSSFGKIDRDRNEFGKIDRSEREKLQSKREMFFKQETSTNSTALNNHNNHNVTATQQISATSVSSATTPSAVDKVVTAINNGHTNAATVNNLNNIAAGKDKRDFAHENNHQDSNKMVTERQDREKQQAIVRPKPKELEGYVGFANLPNQVYRKAVKKGFEFTLMVVGESGLGKSTLINSMFLADIYNQDQHPGPSLRVKKTVQVETTKVLLKENGVNLTLTVVDTPGFGDAVDNSNCWVPVIDFVESKYEEYLTAESRVHRKAMSDSRVHVCLYFIAPSGHGLKPLDVEFMQRLCDKVNIIPVIAKADTMTPEEVQLFKKQILNEIAQHKIKIYDFPEPLEDEEEAKVLKQLRSRVPFAVVGANVVIDVDGRKVRGRRYPWGVAEVENLEHCDFIALRNMVIRTHLHDLKDVTNNVHYENYRCRKLAGLGNDGKSGRLSNKNPLAQMEEEKRDHELKMKKMEAEMEQVFEMKVKEKKQKLKDSEIELTRRHEERKKTLEIQIRELEDRRRAFEQEKKEWEEANGVTLEELRRRSLEANSKEKKIVKLTLR
ncbi:septin-7 isoform X14 [Lutzomyia longipalpis]|uniref:septin-7 isoform X14 n=1 Tax=Lutzomyia longipalpis TaxID=7200 RepID=UPI0024839E68|nr:septin-7 isoform X14 [Lutzomyia longipalpis]XP_055688933.1 septin-7 isoform X14 [Lutzomyia longipalpis]XP_055688934.1 septin-7 isoform X14 [Lutzomyia longipalpis]